MTIIEDLDSGPKVPITAAGGLEGVRQELSVMRNKDLGGVVIQAVRAMFYTPTHEVTDTP
jgi:hypothetical protein